MLALNGLTETLAKELNPSWNIKVWPQDCHSTGICTDVAFVQITILELGYVATRGSEQSTIIPTIHPAYNDPSLPSYQARSFAGSNPKFPVSPEEATVQIHKLVDLETPPLHFPLGKDAIQACIVKSKVYAEAAEKYASWSEGLGSWTLLKHMYISYESNTNLIAIAKLKVKWKWKCGFYIEARDHGTRTRCLAARPRSNNAYGTAWSCTWKTLQSCFNRICMIHQMYMGTGTTGSLSCRVEYP